MKIVAPSAYISAFGMLSKVLSYDYNKPSICIHLNSYFLKCGLLILNFENEYLQQKNSSLKQKRELLFNYTLSDDYISKTLLNLNLKKA